MAAPWTQMLSVHWRPELRFYEQRIAILRDLEDSAVLRAFRVGDDHIDARLLDVGHELSIRQDGLTLALFGQDADLEAVWPFIMVAVERMAPSRIGNAQARLQHVVPLELSFEDAVAVGLERLYSLPPINEVEYGDWALLIDLAVPGEMTGQVEFGVIRSHEAPARLVRSAGRMDGGKGLGQTRWQETRFPDVAMFSDSRWTRPGESDYKQFADVRDFWTAAGDRAAGLVDTLYEKISLERYNGGDEKP